MQPQTARPRASTPGRQEPPSNDILPESRESASGERDDYEHSDVDDPLAPSDVDDPLAPSDVADSDRQALPVDVSPTTDLGNAHRLRALHGADLQHNSSLGWLVWDGQRFQADAVGEAQRRAHSVSQRLLQEAGELMVCASSEVGKEKREALIGQAEGLKKWARDSQNEKKLKAMLEVGKNLEGIAVGSDVFDRDPMLLNCSNGTLDFRTRDLREHRRGDLITKIAPVDYDAEALCPNWLAFLDRIFAGNPELIAFVQRALGYSMTGDTREQCFFVCHGGGSNGKSTLLETVRELLGDYALNTGTDTFLRTRDSRGAENDVARLRGARFVSAVESGEGRKLDEERIKRLTGGDTVTARFLYKEHFEFVPAAKIWLAVNDRPEVTGIDHGIWRRVRLIPFNITIPDHQQDKDLPAKLRAEAPGIFAWMLRGRLDWQETGLRPPKEVTAATTEWRHDANTVHRFVDECCERNPSVSARASALYKAFADWSQAQGEEPVSAKKFGVRLAALGFKPTRTLDARLWEGVVLRRDEGGHDA